MSAHQQTAPTPDEYRDRLRGHLDRVFARTARPTRVPLSACGGRVTAADVTAPMDLPLFVNSQMDGYAVHSDEVADATAEHPVVLTVARVTAAGDPPGAPLERGTAVKVMTGGALPEGTCCVIPVEDTEPVSPDSIAIRAPRAEGTFVRRPGDDAHAGDLVLPAGTLVRARHLAAAASMGLTGLEVLPMPRIAVVATGSELVPPGRDPAPGQVYESNALTLAEAAREAGCEVEGHHTTGDDPAEFEAALSRAARADLVVTAGAVSMGDFEVVRQTLEGREGAWFGHIGMQPGGPQGVGEWRGTPVVCLPGNPVSALVSWTVLVRPLVREAAGLPPLETTTRPITTGVRSPAGRRQYLRGVIEADGSVTPVSGAGSHLIASMARADVLAAVPAEATEIAAGTGLECTPL